MGDVMEFDMGNGGSRGRPPPRIASRLASGRRSSGAKSTDGPLRARPPSGRADAKGSEPGTIAAKRPSVSSVDSFGTRERDFARRGRGSSDDEAAAKPRARRVDSPTGYGRASPQRRGSVDAGARVTSEGKFRLGQKVEGRFRGKGRWYKGRIIGVKGRGKYDVRYEDGDEDLNLDSSAIKSEGTDAASGNGSNQRRGDDRRDVTGARRVPLPRIGDRVEARVPGTTRWQGATVVGENRNGTLDVRLRNGVEEKQLEPSMIRPLEGGGGARGGLGRDGRGGNESASDVEPAFGRATGGEPRRPGSRSPGRRVKSGGGSDGDLNAQPSFHEGDKIEARYKRGRKWYPGVIQAINRDSTMDIKYQDGDREYDVEPVLVRSVGTASADSLATSNSAASDVARRGHFAVGDKVEARFGGRSRWFKATVDAKNRDGSYVLTYDDGDVERRVESDLIRRIDGGPGKRPGSRSPGRRVVSGVGSDSEADPGRGGKLREGDGIEARYKRGRKWYPGVIQAINRDGTMDIKYKDGDQEYDVEPGLVRSVGTASANSLATSNSATSVAARGGHRNSGDFAIGEKVEARFGGRTRWFKATVDAKNRDGSYVLTYDDGDVERRVDSDLIRRIDGGPGKRSGSRSPGRRVVSGVISDSEADPGREEKLREGDEVEARYKRGRKWYPGTIQAINRDGTMDITYKDGDREYDVEPAMVRGSKSADSIAASTGGVAAKEEFVEGDRVEARFGGRSRWLRATVERKNRDGTYWLIYEDGDQERAVESSLIRMRGSGASPKRSSTAPAAKRGVSTVDSASDLEPPQKPPLRINDEIEARYKGGRKWYSGKVRALNRDGTYDIRYADGDTERDVKPEFVRVTSVVSLDSAAGGDDFAEGEKVEARFGGRSRWFKGKIERKNRDGSYRIHYADGDEELAVEKHMIRRVESTTAPRAGSRSPGRRVVSGVESETDNAAGKTFRVGDEVEARYKRGRKWFPGKVRAVNRDGTMDIKYKDGDSERDVEPGFVRSLGATSTTSLATSTSGASETARGGDRRRVGEGDHGRRHLREKTNSIDSLTSDLGHGRTHNIGDKVEARFRGGSRWYKATVERANPDGSYYLIYEDGDKERAVDGGMIRSLGKASGEVKRNEKDATAAVVAHRVGDAVEARYKRGLRWYAGTVRRINRDGTMDVEYKDGDFERDVEAAFVRQIGGKRAGDTSSAFAVGDKVEGRFGGGARWFKATVERENRDGTFCLLYADGDKERAVKREFIRTPDGGRIGGRSTEKEKARGSTRSISARANSETGSDVDKGEGKKSDRVEVRDKEKRDVAARAGDVVEARFRGGSRWLTGEATRVHRDGSYDIEYDDGQSERYVQAGHVRLPAKQRTRSTDSSDADRRKKDVDPEQAGAAAIMEGDRVEARLRGRSTWHDGEVTRVHSDGTYDVRYSRDGELEKRLEPRLVRRPLTDAPTTRDGRPRASSRGRSGMDSSSDAQDSGPARDRGRREPVPQNPVSEDAKAAATKVRRALRRTGKTVNDFARKLERVRRASGGRDSRGRSVVGNIDKYAFEKLLAGVGVELSPHESRALRRCCPDGDNDGCVDPSTLASLVRGRSGSPAKRPRSSGSRTRGGRSPSSSSAAASVLSASDSAAGTAAAARPKRVRRKSRSRSRSQHRDGSSSSRDDASSGSASHRRHIRGQRNPGSGRRSSSAGGGRKGRGRSLGEAGTSSESGGDAEGQSNSRGNGSALVGKVALRALQKLEGPAMDGSLRQEFDKLSGGRRRDLSISRLKPLLRRVRIKLEESPLAEVTAVVDPDDVRSFSLEGILEAALSTVEGEEISKIHSIICEQLFKPSGRVRGKQRKETREAQAATGAVSKAFAKMDHPKGSGLLVVGDLQKSLQKAGAKVSSDDAELLIERLDPADRGKVDREALVIWLTSGFDTARAELRASGQLRLLRARKNASKPKKAFREFDADRRGEVKTKDFVTVVRNIGLILTHGQAIALASRHHTDYEGFIADMAAPRNRSSEEEETISDGSDNSGGGTEGRKSRRRSWIESFGRRRQSSSNTSRSKRKDGGGGGHGESSGESDGPLTSGSSSEREQGGDEEGGLLLGRRARAALRDAFERVCSATGGVKEIFCSAAGATEHREFLSGRDETRRFLRRLKLDITDEDRATLLNSLAGPPRSSDAGGHSSRGAGERGVSFESDGGRKKRTKRGGGGSAGGKSDGDGEESGGGGGGEADRILYRDFLELVLADQESKEMSKIHGRMSKDLAKAIDRSGKPTDCPFSLVVKGLSKHDAEATGYVKASGFKRSLEKLGFGGLSSAEKSLLVRRFDPVEDGMINYEAFGAWLSSGLDPDRLIAKLGRLLGQLTGKSSRSQSTSGSRAESGDRKKISRGSETSRDKAKKNLQKVGVRGFFEELDEDAAGTVSRHDMKVVLRRTLGLPLTEGDLRALFKRLDKEGDGMLDYEELLALASKKERSERDGGTRRRSNGILSKLKEKGSAMVRGAPGKNNSKRRRDSGGSSDGSDGSREDEDQNDNDKEDHGAGAARKRTGKDREKKKKKKRKKKEKEGLGKGKKDRGGGRERDDGQPGSSRRNDVRKELKGARLESKLLRLRISILQQSTVTAAAGSTREREGGSDRSGDEKEDSGDGETGDTDPAAISAKWTAMFEARDRAGTGKATVADFQAILEKAGVRIPGDDVSLLASVFAAHPSSKGGQGSRRDDVEREEEEEGAVGNGEAEGMPSSPAAIDYDGFVRWLSEGGGLNDALLGKVQRHLKARLSKAMDLRALFTEMCDGSSGGSSGGNRTSKRHDRSSNKETLSSSSLARGLRHAGLPLNRAVVKLLVAAFSTSGGGGSGGRGRRQNYLLSYADVHRMVNCDGLLALGSSALGAGSSTLDEEIRSKLLETVERAFAFYDEDNANSIDATEVVNILRALGHDLTRGESRALLRKANVDRNGTVEFEGFQEAVMPFLLERANSKRRTEGEMRAMFDEIDPDRSGSIKREEFSYLFCGKLRLLSHQEAEALLSLLDRHHSGQIAWEEFVKLFELIDDRTGGGGIAALPADLKEVVVVALRKLQMGALPDVEGQLSSFLGMPSTCRKSVLAPLDSIKELSLQWVLMPKLDSRGCIQLQDMSVKVTTEVAEVEASKAPPEAQGQVLVKTANLADRGSDGGKSRKKSPTKSLAATLGFGKRDKSPPPAVTESKGTKTRRRSSILGAGLMETTTTVMKRATLQEVGASTEEGGGRGRGGGGGRRDGSITGGGVMQVELSVKHAFGIPVARDSRMGDIRQRGMRACLFYDASREVDKNTGEASAEYGEHFLCNTYKTLAIQHPQKEEQWLFPDSSEGERKFLVRTDFGGGSGNGSHRHRRRSGSSGNGHKRDQGTREESPPRSSSFRGDRKRLFLLVELTCTVQTVAMGDGRDSHGDGATGGGTMGARGADGAVRGPLKNFRRGQGRKRIGGIRRRGRSDDVDDDGSASTVSAEGSSADDYSEDVSKDDDEGWELRKGKSGRSDADSDSNDETKRRPNQRSGRRKRGGTPKRRVNESRADTARTRGRDQHASGRAKSARSAPPRPRRGDGRRGAASRVSRDRGGVRSEGPGESIRRPSRNNSRSGSDSNDDEGSHSGDSRSSSASGRATRGRRRNDRWAAGKGMGSGGGGGGGWRRGWGGRAGANREGSRRTTGGSEEVAGDGGDEMVEVEMSCGWVLIPFLELVEAHEVKKVRYKLLGGTPFAKTDINEDEVMTRRYGWRAVLKAMKIEGMHKGSEVEIKILPVNTLSKVKQDDIFRLPRNVILSDTFVSLVRHYREYAANSLAKRSARGMGNVGFGAGLASSEPVLALFPRLAADPALILALKNQWEAEVRKMHVDGRLGATLSSKLVGLGLGGGGGNSGGGLAGVTGAAREACMMIAFEKAVLRLWPAFCHIDAQRRRGSEGKYGAESYEELESRGQRIRQILDSTDSFHSDTPTNAVQRGEAGGGRRGVGGGAFSSAVSQEGRVMVAFTLKEVAFDVA